MNNTGQRSLMCFMNECRSVSLEAVFSVIFRGDLKLCSFCAARSAVIDLFRVCILIVCGAGGE